MALLETFGATSDDAASLRIPSLKEMTVDDLERMWVRSDWVGGEGAEAAGGRSVPPVPKGDFHGSAGGVRCGAVCDLADGAMRLLICAPLLRFAGGGREGHAWGCRGGGGGRWGGGRGGSGRGGGGEGG